MSLGVWIQVGLRILQGRAILGSGVARNFQWRGFSLESRRRDEDAEGAEAVRVRGRVLCPSPPG